ncbi:glycoprotein [Matariya virus]|uniref:Glycoprotein n=1 Tax=Matariya virus TaxID=1272948 RepID=A0AAE8XBN9_9RHAB|nr:glycoprotein [Matariya virus]UAU42908.1 glycoprotein [Matariya virus]WAD86867.1 glycoprotein [Matariya virus]
MLLSTIIVIFSLILPQCWNLEYMYFPTKIDGEFNPIHLDHLNCPYDIDDTEIENPVEIPSKILVTNLIDVSGEVCYKQRWVTSCYENFFGKQTIHHKIEHLPVTQDDLAHKMSLDSNLVPPDANCQWMSDTDTEDSKVICQPVTIKYDETLNLGSHPSLGTFHCKTPPCSIDSKHLFVSNNITNTQKGYKDVNVKFSTDKNGHIHETSFVKSDIFPKMSLEGACVSMTKSASNNNHAAKLILQSGILLEIKDAFDLGSDDSYNDGTSLHTQHDIANLKKLLLKKFKTNSFWGQTMFNLNSKSRMTFHNDVTGKFKQLGKLFVDLRICQTPDFNRVVVPTLDFQRSMTEMFVESKIDQLSCKRRLYDIISSGSINGADLGLLAQNHEGPGPVYHIHGNDLTMAYGKYERFTWMPGTVGGKQYLGYTHKGDVKQWVSCPEWVQDKENAGVRWCVNGIFERNGSLYHPVFGGDNIEDLRIAYQNRNLRKVEHISLLLQTENKSLSTWEEYFKLESKHTFEGFSRISDWFNSLSTEIKYIIYMCCTILILFIVVRLLRRRHRAQMYRDY